MRDRGECGRPDRGRRPWHVNRVYFSGTWEIPSGSCLKEGGEKDTAKEKKKVRAVLNKLLNSEDETNILEWEVWTVRSKVKLSNDQSLWLITSPQIVE